VSCSRISNLRGSPPTLATTCHAGCQQRGSSYTRSKTRRSLVDSWHAIRSGSRSLRRSLSRFAEYGQPMPHVSVVIPVFNSAHYVTGALRSVFAQTFDDFEVIIVDDGSEDREALLAALAEFAGRIHYVRHENGGPAKARNTGVAHATGELVAFL